MNSLRLFISYAHKDDELRKELEEHLSSLKRQYTLDIWSDRAIEPGQEWESSISERLRTADIILLLISPSFLASEYVYKKELKQAMERHEVGKSRVIPIFVRPCDWKKEVFGKLQGLPDDAKPISRWQDRDEAFTIVAIAIRTIVEALASKRVGQGAYQPQVSRRLETTSSERPLVPVWPYCRLKGRDLHYTPRIHCPYCEDGEFWIKDVAENDVREHTTDAVDVELASLEYAELLVLPYARDVDIFDPFEDQGNSRWTRVGRDFYGKLSWDRYLGILQVESEVKVYYCVASCPECQKLMDVFVNFTRDIGTFSSLWPQLLGQNEKGEVAAYEPRELLFLVSSRKTFLLSFLALVYFGSFLPAYFEQRPSGIMRFLKDNYSSLSVRGTMAIALFFLLVLRHGYIELFRRKKSFQRLFQLRDPSGLTYWSNYAVSRFIGYQRGNHRFTVNAVVLLGGCSSLIALAVSWTLAQLGVLGPNVPQSAYSTCAELLFWIISAYLTGIVVWNVSIIPHYVLRGLERMPLRPGVIEKTTDGTQEIEKIGIYGGLGIFILLACIGVLSLLPVFVKGIHEPAWEIIWAQLSLVFCYCFVIIRFSKRREHGLPRPGSADLELKPATRAALLFAAYGLLRYELASVEKGLRSSYLPGAFEQVWPRNYIEASVFLLLSLYLFHLVMRSFKFIIRKIRVNAKRDELQRCEKRYEDLRQDSSLSPLDRQHAEADYKRLLRSIEAAPSDGILYEHVSSFMKGILFFLSAVGSAVGGLLGYLAYYYKP